MTLLKKMKMEKVTSKNNNRTLSNRNANKTTALNGRSNYIFVVG